MDATEQSPPIAQKYALSKHLLSGPSFRGERRDQHWQALPVAAVGGSHQAPLLRLTWARSDIGLHKNIQARPAKSELLINLALRRLRANSITMSFLHKARTVVWGERPATKQEQRLLLKIDWFVLSYTCLSELEI